MSTSEETLETKLKNRLFQALDEVVETSLKKFRKEKAGNKDRQSWARLIVSAAKAYGSLYQLIELAELEARVAEIEANAKRR